MPASRIRSVVVLLGLAASGLALIAWTQRWFAVILTDGQQLEVAGDAAAPALATLSLAGLALHAALTIAGPVFRVILGVLAVAIGALVAGSAVGALAQPVSAVASSVSEATGVAGENSVVALVDSLAATVWVFLAVIAGFAVAFNGIAILLTLRIWPQATRRYTVRWQSAEADPAVRAESKPTALDDWDSLSHGDDPTSERPVE